MLTHSLFHGVPHRKQRIQAGQHLCPGVVPAVVSNIIYTPPTLGFFGKNMKGQNSSRAFKDLHNH